MILYFFMFIFTQNVKNEVYTNAQIPVDMNVLLAYSHSFYWPRLHKFNIVLQYILDASVPILELDLIILYTKEFVTLIKCVFS